MTTERKGYHGPSTFEGQPQCSPSSKPPWYNANITSIAASGRSLLESYSDIPAADVLPHVLALRDKAFAIWSYACIGQVRFLDYTLPHHPYYTPTLDRLRSGANLLDAGCCFGQELRFLVHKEGIPANQLYGCDLEPGFVEIGYELFRDKGRFGAHMLSGDLLADPKAPEAEQLKLLERSMDVVHVASVLHSWGWDDMICVAKRLVGFTRPKPGSMIVGNQMGSLNAGEYPMPTGKAFNYRHNVETMERFWKQVGEETGSEWKVESGLFLPAVVKENQGQSWAKNDQGLRMIWFMATCV
ncbi:hypothetical protein ABVK25_012033 [Lepraria finkii]|uniref:Methyltransferase type 11 domain-containing protein n=1 Tax=Lepraria finkii TaxID=1340010 RepID=A0ABR4AL55_9LECA